MTSAALRRLAPILAACLALVAVWAPVSRADEPVTGSVYGWVSAGGQAPAGARVVLTRGTDTRSTPVDADTSFTVDGLTAGRWTIRLELPPGTGLRLLAPDGPTRLAQDEMVVDVEPGRATLAPYLALTDWAELTGRVTDDAGTPVPAHVYLHRVGSASGPDGAGVSEDGTWRALVPPGDYRIEFETWSWRWMKRWFHGPELSSSTASEPAGEVVTAPAAGTINGLDAALSRIGTVTGRVTDGAGRPVGDAQALARTGPLGIGIGGMGMAHADGTYEMHLTPGRYRVSFSSPGTLLSWYGGAALSAGAPQITVAAGATVTGIDGVLRQGAAMSGRVRDTQGRPVPAVQVSLDMVGSTPARPDSPPGGVLPAGSVGSAATAITDAEGRWGTGHSVPEGTYVVSAVGRMDSDWAPTTYGVDAPGEQPRIVSVTAPNTRSGVNLVMRHVGEPFLVSPRPVLPVKGTVTLPLSCPTGCAVDLRAPLAGSVRPRRARPAARTPRVLARGRGRVGARRIRLRLNRLGRRAVADRTIRATVRARPKRGPTRTFAVRVRRHR